MRAGSVAVAGHALDCAECAGNAPNALGMRRMRWNVLDCAVLRRIAPNCADCADCAELRRLRRCALFAPNCAGIALEFCLQPGTQPYTHGWRSLVATSLLAACSFRAVPVVPGFLWLTTPPVPAVLRFFFNCQSCRETNNAGQKLNNFLLPPIQLLFLARDHESRLN